MKNSLKEFIELIVEDEKKEPRTTAAGIVLLRKGERGLEVLCLRQKGGYDLPKGRSESGEDAITTAKRETFEETGVSKIDFPLGMISIRIQTMVMYLGFTDQEGEVRPNPKTGKREHINVEWLSINDAEKAVHNYLKAAVRWARSKVKGENVP